MASLQEIKEEMAAKSEQLAALYREGGGAENIDLDKITSLVGDRNYKVAELKRRMDEINGLGQELDRLESVSSMGQAVNMMKYRLNEPAGGSGPSFPNSANPMQNALNLAKPGAMRQFLLENKHYQLFRANAPQAREIQIELPGIGLKTLITLATVNVQAERLPQVALAQEVRTVGDLMAQGETSNNTLEYYEQTTFTNAAATVAEGGTKPESAFAWTLRTDSIRKVAHWIPTTKESLDDVPWLETQIRNDMAFGLQLAEESQLLNGNGVAPNILGLLNRSGLQTQALGGDPKPDAIFKGMQKVRGASGSGFAEPTAYITHPNDWTEVKLIKTLDGQYLYGGPAEEGPERIWGKEVRQTTAMAEGTGLVGAFRPYSTLVRREGVTIILSTEHSTYAVENKVALIAEERIGLVVTRPSAFCTITGI